MSSAESRNPKSISERLTLVTVYAAGDPLTTNLFYAEIAEFRQVTNAIVQAANAVSGNPYPLIRAASGETLTAAAGAPASGNFVSVSGLGAVSPSVAWLSGNVVAINLNNTSGAPLANNLSGVLFTILAQGY